MDLFEFLGHAEDYLQRMIRGIFHFLGRLPRWCHQFLVESVGPFALRLGRVLALAFAWLLLLFGPAYVFGFQGWLGWISLSWIGLSVAGSVWGLRRLVKEQSLTRSNTNLATGRTR